jgi:hypothetical protein
VTSLSSQLESLLLLPPLPPGRRDGALAFSLANGATSIAKSMISEAAYRSPFTDHPLLFHFPPAEIRGAYLAIVP